MLKVNQWISGLSTHHKYLESLLKCITEPHPQSSWFLRSRVRLCISNNDTMWVDHSF